MSFKPSEIIKKKQNNSFNYKQHLQDKIGADTYNTDIEQFNKDYGADYLSNWHTADEINSYYDRLASITDRTKAYQSYVNLYGTDEQKAVLGDIDKQVKSYSDVLGQRQNVLDYYGGFESADAYAKGQAYAEEQRATAQAEQERIASLDLDAVRAEIANLDTRISDYEKQRRSIISTSASTPSAQQERSSALQSYKTIIEQLNAKKSALESDISTRELMDRQRLYADILGSDEFASFTPSALPKSDVVGYANMGPEKNVNPTGLEVLLGLAGAEDFQASPYVTAEPGSFEETWAAASDKRYAQMTEDQKKLYSFLREKYGQDVADQYTYDLDNELIQKEKEDLEKMGSDNPIISSLFSVAISPMQSVEALAETARGVTTGNMRQGYGATAVTGLREGAKQTITNGNKVGGFLYDTGVSMLDSILAMSLGGSAGGAILGASAASSAQNDVLARGGTAEQALASGLASGFFEGFFESFSIGALSKMQPNEIVKNFKVFATNALKNVATNASEELATEIANIVFDSAYMGELSNAAIMFDQYMRQGLTEAEAKNKVAHELGVQALGAAASGALMGFGFSAIGGGVGLAKTDSAQRQLGKNQIKEGNVESLLTDAKELFKDAKYKDEQALIKKVEANLGKKGPSQQRNVGKLTGRVISTKSRELNKQVAEKSIENVAETRKNVESETKKLKVNSSSAEINYDNMPQILGFEGANLDKTMVETEQGAVKLTDMEISNAEIGDLYAYAVRLGNTESANAFIQNWDQTTDPLYYWLDWTKLQTRGLYAPEKMEKAMSDYSDVKLSPAAKLAAFKSGMSLRTSAREKMEADSAKLKETYKELGGKAKKGKFDDSKLNYSALTKEQKDVVNFTKILSDYLGVNITYFKSEKGKRGANGYYRAKNNTIYLDIYAGIGNKESYSAIKDCLVNTVSHEVVHNMAVNAPAEYGALRDFVIERLSEEEGFDLDSRVEQIMLENSDQGFTAEDAIEEIVAMSCENLLGSSERLQEAMTQFYAKNEKAANSFTKYVREVLNRLKQFFEKIIGKKSIAEESQLMAKQSADFIAELQKRYDAALLAVREGNAVRNTLGNLTATEQVTLAESGIAVDETTGDVHKVRNSVRYSTANKDAQGNIIDLVTVGKKSFNTEAIAKLVSTATGRSIEDARKWVRSEMAIANLVMDNPEFLDFEPDDRYQGIKKNSDYPQGTVDLSNLCPKREEFTTMFDLLQKKYPDKLFTAADVASMREILKNHGITVACGACFVEDRRQLLGEIADTYINMWREAVENGTPLQKTNAEGKKIKLQVTAALAKQYGLTKGADIMATDKYIPTQHDLTTYEGFKLLEKNHPLVAMGFNRYNNSRGQQAGRLIEGRAEYDRQILGWTPNKVKTVNNNGGLRIFSFSDFEVVHLLDLVQVIIDCAAMGVKIQGYTKIPAFARLVRNTGIKLNRSLIPKGETGIKVVNGKEVLDIDLVEGINIEDENFLDESDNDNVGNIIIGINPKQIGIAMLDDFIDYIIPFHTNKSKDICRKLGVGEWNNYKESQHEKDIETGKASKHNVNIYTQVINKYHPKNKIEFVDAFLKECRSQKKVPRYSEFLYKEYKSDGAYSDEGGRFNYTYREGYHKLLVDFKMFDKEGNILPQGDIVPELDDAFMAELLDKEIARKKDYTFPQEVYDEIDRVFGDGGKVMYQKRTETPGASEVLSELFRDNPNLNGYADQRKELKSYQELLRSVKVNEQRIAEIDAEIKSLKSQKAQGGKGTRMAQLYEMRKTAENRVTEKKNRMFKMEATSLRDVVTKETARLLQERTEEERTLSRQKQKEIRENYARREYIKKIEQRAKGLQEALTKNSKDKHIPEPFKKVVSDLITSIDFSSKRSLAGKGETKKDLRFAIAMKNMSDSLNLQGIEGSKGDIQKFITECDLGEEFIQKFSEEAKKINAIALKFGSQDEYVLNRMSAEDLKKVNSLLYHLSNAIAKSNQLIGNSLTDNMNQLGQQFIKDAEEYDIAKKKGLVTEFLDLRNTLPYYAFKRMGKVGMSLFNEWADGFDKYSFLIDEIIEFTEKAYTAKEVKQWSNEVHRFTGADGTELYLTTADIMSLYLLNKRGQGLKHIQGGGIQAEEIKGKAEGDKIKKTYKNSANGVTTSEQMLVEVLSTLTDRQREVADKLQQFLATTAADWGNEISMRRFGTKQFTEKDYFPIETSRETLTKEGSYPNTNDIFALLNMAFTKILDENANNRIMIRNVFDVFAEHTTMMAKYNAFAVPLLDMRKFLNYKVKFTTDDDEKSGTSFHTDEVRAALVKHYGTEYEEYIDNFIKDIAGATRSEKRGVEFSQKFMSKYKIAAVAFNMRVVVLQGTSYLRASAILEHKYLLQEIKDTPQLRRAIKTMEQYSGVAKWKSFGYHDVNVTKSVTEKIKHADTWMDKVTEASMKGAEIADKMTWGALWLACENEIKSKQKGFVIGSKEFYEATATRFREVIYATQVVDSPLTKSEFMRSKDGLAGVLGSFMSEPTVSYNLLLDAYHEIADTKRKGQKISWNNMRRVGRLAIAYAASAVAQTIVESLIDAMRDVADDEDEEYIDAYFKNALENIFKELSPFRKLPILKDIIDVVEKTFFGGYASNQRMDVAVVERLARAVREAYKLITGETSVSKTLKRIIDAISSGVGLPISNAYRELKTIWNNLMEWFNDGSGRIE